MKVAILSESPADEAALRVLANAILGLTTKPPEHPPFRARGWPNVYQMLPGVMRALYYQSDVRGLVVVVDSNGSPPHEGGPAANCATDRCRLCVVRREVHQTRDMLKHVVGRAPFSVAIGVAMPAIEAWYRCGIDPHATEVAWIRDLRARTTARSRMRELKNSVYGTDRPSLELATKCAVEHCERVARTIGELENAFPVGFGAVAAEVRTWREVPE
ncbi:MAG: hypothetical protein CHACPFDD_03378 [Phycisphaerae bacterium]|nr:hypothetical protein [Phycisphaerae bacterium]